MKGHSVCRRATRELFPSAMQYGITLVAIVAMLLGGCAKTSHAADAFQAAVLNADSGALALSKVGSGRDQLQSSPSVGINTARSFSDQIAGRTSDRRYVAALRVAAGDDTFWTLSAVTKDVKSCGNLDPSFDCLNRRLASISGTQGAVSTAGFSGAPDLPGHIILAAANQSARSRESIAAIRYTDTPGHNESDVVTGNGASTSPIFEPKIYTMMLTGLGLMGFVASRRQT